MEYSSGDGASQTNLALIGAGVMGEAIASALLSKGACDPRHLSVSDVRDYRLDALGQQLGVNTCSSNREAVAGASVILLAVKPQAMDTVLSDISDAIGSDQLVISVAAGIDTEWIERRLLPGAGLFEQCQIPRALLVWVLRQSVRGSTLPNKTFP